MLKVKKVYTLYMSETFLKWDILKKRNDYIEKGTLELGIHEKVAEFHNNITRNGKNWSEESVKYANVKIRRSRRRET